jgi:hypothetical protein
MNLDLDASDGQGLGGDSDFEEKPGQGFGGDSDFEEKPGQAVGDGGDSSFEKDNDYDDLRLESSGVKNLNRPADGAQDDMLVL